MNTIEALEYDSVMSELLLKVCKYENPEFVVFNHNLSFDMLCDSILHNKKIDLWKDINEWLKSNMEGHYFYSFSLRIINEMIFIFENKNDAMLFKLYWIR